MTLVEEAGERWLVAPYGEVGWVRNTRSAEQVTLTRGRRFEKVKNSGTFGGGRRSAAKEVSDSSACGTAVLDVTPRSNLRDFIAEASRHPVFRIQ